MKNHRPQAQATAPVRVLDRCKERSERGQTTAEYALVLLAAATVAMLVVTWAQDNNSIGAFLDDVLSKITSLID